MSVVQGGSKDRSGVGGLMAGVGGVLIVILTIWVLSAIFEDQTPRQIRCVRCGGSGSFWIALNRIGFVKCPICKGRGRLA